MHVLGVVVLCDTNTSHQQQQRQQQHRDWFCIWHSHSLHTTLQCRPASRLDYILISASRYLHQWWNCWGIQPMYRYFKYYLIFYLNFLNFYLNTYYLAFMRISSRSNSGSGDWMRRDLVQYCSNYPPQLLCFVIPNILIPTIHCWVFYGILFIHPTHRELERSTLMATSCSVPRVSWVELTFDNWMWSRL